MSGYLNIHAHATHSWTAETIYSYDIHEQLPDHPPNTLFSCGLHPWHLTDDNCEDSIKELEKLISSSQMVMIGECGFDRIKGPSIATQIHAFEAQTRLARQHALPMILHCVKAFDLLLAYKKKHRHPLPLIIHGFRGKPLLARQLSDKGFYLSVGPQILQDRKAAYALLSSLDRPFFIETDNQTLPIEELYHEIAILLNLEVEQLKDRIFAAWKLIGLLKNE